MTKVILFDLDDTLINTQETKIRALQFAGKNFYNLDINQTDIIKNWGKPFKQFISELFGNVDDIEKIIEKYNSIRDQFPAHAYPHTISTINALLTANKIGVISSSIHSQVISDLQINHFPLDQFFYIQTMEDTLVHKPDPEVFNPILKILSDQNSDILKSDIYYIGDHLFDYYAARDAGIKFFGLSDRTTTNEIFLTEGANTIRSISELITLI